MNTYATDAASLGEGLKNVASTMAMSNVDLDKTLSLLVGGGEITQNVGEFANALKVSVLRLRGQKGKLEELGEYADDIESVSKMQTQILNLTKGAVNIMEASDPTKFRDYWDVMRDIAKTLPTLTETDSADLIEILFGKQRANQGMAMLQAFQSGQIEKAYQTSLSSEGSALQEHSRWLDSVQAKTQQFQAAWQSLSQTFISSDFLKGFIDTGTRALNILDFLVDKAGTLNTLIGGFLLTKAIKSARSGKLHRLQKVPLVSLAVRCTSCVTQQGLA